jgi:hypothetical protein
MSSRIGTPRVEQNQTSQSGRGNRSSLVRRFICLIFFFGKSDCILILDFTLTYTRYDSSHVHTTGQLTDTRRSDGAPELDGALREVDRKKILHYRKLYINRPDPIAFLPVAVDTTGRLYSYPNIKGSVGLILANTSAMRISIPLDLSSRPFIPLPRFICRRRPLPLLAPSLVFTPRRSA